MFFRRRLCVALPKLISRLYASNSITGGRLLVFYMLTATRNERFLSRSLVKSFKYGDRGYIAILRPFRYDKHSIPSELAPSIHRASRIAKERNRLNHQPLKTMQINWNLTDKVLKYKKADVFILSVAKSGRTWLRMLLSKYFSIHFNATLSISDLYQPVPEMPKLMYGHERWSHLVEAKFSKRLFGRYIIPDSLIKKKKVVMFYRDLRDVMVSLYFEKTKRADQRIQMSISDFIRDSKYGVDSAIKVMNGWRKQLEHHPACIWKSYEELKANPHKTLHEVLDFIGIKEISSDHIDEAVEFSKFENMKKMEANNVFDTPILRPGDLNDPNSFKVREGKVGGYKKHLSESDLNYLEKQISRLDPFFKISHQS